MKIHVSENTKLLLDQIGGFHLEKRGNIEIKASIYDFLHLPNITTRNWQKNLNLFQKDFYFLMNSVTNLFCVQVCDFFLYGNL